MKFLAIFCVTLFATFLSAMSGGGASTINLPVFLLLGIPFPLYGLPLECRRRE
ncbi:MAG: hypothetical protein V1926_01875 [Candidatus Peregrinibacteria bacterium]